MGSILGSLGLGEMGRYQVEAVANPGYGQLIGQPLRIAAQLAQDLLLLLGVAQAMALLAAAGVKLDRCQFRQEFVSQTNSPRASGIGQHERQLAVQPRMRFS